ncbi:MAG: TonB-dependent receptor, partial [Anaerolineaceae bacterium]|nr:TonB-dependent receptor [Anaerolineaceae bacterium]
MNNRNMRTGGFLAFMASVFATAPGVAQDRSANTRAMTIEEVVVTAQRREESLQEAPISVFVMGASDLENQGIRSITELGEGSVPNLRISPFGSGVSTHVITVRGVSALDPGQISRESTTGVYLDGVYLGRAQGLSIDQMDLERVEVLRGPQGTLFGRNALGGAISLVSKKPSGEWGFQQTVGVGNYDALNSITRIDLPEIAGVSAKIDYLVSERDGWVKNPARGQSDWSAVDKEGGRIALLWQAADNFTVEYAYDRSRSAQVSNYMHIDSLLPGAEAFPEGEFQQLESSRVSRGRTGALNEPSTSRVWGHTLNLNWDLNDQHTLRLISAYRNLRQSQFNSFGGAFFRPGPATGNLFGRLSLAEVRQDQISHEFQWLGNLDRLEFVAGAFYFKESAQDAQSDPFGNQLTANGPIVLPAPLYSRPAPARASDVTSESQALFGQVKWTPGVLNDRLSVTVGGRYNRDEKDGARRLINGESAFLPYSYKENRFDPAVTVAYDWAEGVNAYLRWGTAYRGGGVNSRSVGFSSFDADDIESWELGLKSEFWDRRARLNAAVFYTEWYDQQIDVPPPETPSNT